MRRLLPLFPVFAASLLLLVNAPADSAMRGTVKVRGTQFGRILVDGRGFALYAFTKDGRGRSRCSGACAQAWPPFITSARPRAGTGARASKLGTVRRSDGRLQVTYDGRPLYYYVGDRRPGQVLCQDVVEFGGRWLVMRASGQLVR
jgi:predicted lipoprotein with Yx(FWY)xxD motif